VVGYPILKLGSPTVETSEVSGETLVRTTSEVFIPEVLIPKADYVGYIRKLEDLIIRSLAHFSLVTGQLAGVTGVFVHPDKESRCAFCAPEKRQTPSKIAAIGVKVDGRGISQHGFAINVAPEMNYFEGIIGCGLKDHPAISMAELLPSPPTVQAVMAEVARQFGKRFEYEMTVTDSGMNQ
jgi:lipoate-protein ligase B